jgi:hypothetical protein
MQNVKMHLMKPTEKYLSLKFINFTFVIFSMLHLFYKEEEEEEEEEGGGEGGEGESSSRYLK